MEQVFTIILALHISISALYIVSILLGLRSVIKNLAASIRTSAKYLRWTLLLQIITGTTLTLLHYGPGAWLGLCKNISLYIGLAIIIEVMMHVRLKQAARAEQYV